MNRKPSLGLNAALNGLRNLLNLLFPLITFPYVTRVLTVSEIGIINFSNTYIGYFILLAGLGIATYAIREGAKYRDQPEHFSKFASQVFSINVIATVVAYILLLFSLLIFKNLHNYLTCILIFSLQILFTTLGSEWVYVIYENYTYITARSIAFKLLSIILLFVLVKTPQDYLLYAGINVLASVGSNLLNFIHARSFIQIRLTARTEWRRHLRPILTIFASSVAVMIYVSSDMTILGLMKGSYDAGLYSTPVKIYHIAQGLFSAILTVAIPRMSMLWGKKKHVEYYRVLTRILNILGLLMLPTVVGLIMLSREVILIIAGPKYLPAVRSLQIISWAIVFSIFAWIFLDCILISVGREAKVLRNTIITALVNIVLNLILIPIISYNGAALSTVIAEFLVMIMNAASSWDIVGDVCKSKSLVRNVFTSVIGCLGIVIACLICKYLFSSLIIVVIAAVISSIIVYALILLLFKNAAALELIEQIKLRIFKK